MRVAACDVTPLGILGDTQRSPSLCAITVEAELLLLQALVSWTGLDSFRESHGEIRACGSPASSVTSAVLPLLAEHSR